jgi:hypothetical protein
MGLIHTVILCLKKYPLLVCHSERRCHPLFYEFFVPSRLRGESFYISYPQRHNSQILRRPQDDKDREASSYVANISRWGKENSQVIRRPQDDKDFELRLQTTLQIECHPEASEGSGCYAI